jgi:glutamyl-tRNA reductase
VGAVRAVPLSEALEGLAHYDVVVGSLALEKPVLSAERIREAMRARGGEPLFLIDLGMPRNFAADSDSLACYLYNLDDLAEISARHLAQRTAQVAQCRTALHARADRFWQARQNPPLLPQTGGLCHAR